MTTPSPARVVVVDDEPYLRKIATELLREEGFFVEAFGDPRAARAAVLAEAPTVMVTDYRMPEWTGIDLARAVRSTLGEQCPYVVLWTGSRALVPSHEQALVDVIVDKPCRIAALVGAVRRGVRLRRRRSSGVQAVWCLDRATKEDVGT